MITETLPEFVARLGILCTANKVRGPISCASCGGDRHKGRILSPQSRMGMGFDTRCPNCLNTSICGPLKGDDWNKSATEWRIVFGRAGNLLHAAYFTGSALRKEPTAVDVLNALASDASSVDGVTFEDWANDLGYDSDSRKAEAIYFVCQKTLNDLHKLLGRDDYLNLVFNIARL